MGSVITLNGIDQGISNLNLRNKNTLKYRLISKIRGFYENEGSVEHIKGIDRDELVKFLWNIGDDLEKIKNKRKNLSSTKSSINSSLKRLYKEGKNPEGIIIGPDNVFVMSGEAKDKALEVFKDSMELEGVVSLSRIADVLNIVNEILSNPEAIADTKSGELSNLDKLKDQIQGLSEKVGLGGPNVAEVAEDYEELEEEEIVEDAELEEDLEQIEIDEDLEEAELDDISEEVDEVEETEEADLLEDNLGEEYSDGGYGEDDEIEKARLLAEEFNSSLAAMDKFYNQYIIIQEGEYIVGSKRPKKDEKLGQVVHLSPFYIGKFPITNALFEVFVEKTGYWTTAEKLGYSTVYYGRSQKTIDKKTGLKRLIWNSAIISKTVEGACWYQPLGPGSTLYNKKKHPVVHVSLEDAIAFAAWNGKRLPTEDEWEAASRTANGYVFPWGNDWKKDSCNIEESSIADTAPVDKYIELANDFGIVDTIGNVLEWTSDTSEPPSYVKGNVKYYIVKGGSWISGNDVKLFSRFTLEPESHSNILGFRCVAY